ncbi:hypothetical protein LNP05_20830 [Klebsiella pneumoniae subsp. pneumoniae]|nr:hypothetical protein [Klebsiella pneumoniae subsp. pneumoniae]
MSGSPRDGNRSPDLKGNAPLAGCGTGCRRVRTRPGRLFSGVPLLPGGIFASSTLAVLALRQRRHHTVSDIFCVIPRRQALHR